MSRNHDTNLALFLDFDNVAIGARDARQRFDIRAVLERLLEKGKIVVKKAYADWSYYHQYMVDLHAEAIELIEIPSPRQGGKNSADIRMVVDAMDLCYSNEHVDVFVLVSGDSDFSPLVSKLRENNKEVIGVGMKGSSSKLLISNCDEFIFYEDLMRSPVNVESVELDHVPGDKKKLYNLLVTTIEGLVREHKGPLYSSLIKDTMKRKKPDFNERSWGFSSFSDLLEEAVSFGLLTVQRDEKAGGTFVVTALGGEAAKEAGAAKAKEAGSAKDTAPVQASGGARRPSRRRGGRGRRGRAGEIAKAETPGQDAAAPQTAGAKPATGPDTKPAAAETSSRTPAAADAPRSADAPKKKTAKKAPAKKTTKKKKTAKKATTRKTTAKKTTKKATTKTTAKKATTPKKTTARKAAAKKSDA